MITTFLPQLITAIQDCVQTISDKCRADGLIEESVYRKVLETGDTSIDRARTLVLAVRTTTETDARSLDIFLNILNEALPDMCKNKLLSDITDERLALASQTTLAGAVNQPRVTAIEGATVTHTTSQAVVPMVPSVYSNMDLVHRQNSLLVRYEDSVRVYERTCAEKRCLEKRLEEKKEDSIKLKVELERLGKELVINSVMSSRLSNCEEEVVELKKKVHDLESITEEQRMFMERSRSMIFIRGRHMVEFLRHESEQEIKRRDEKHAADLNSKVKEVTDRCQEQMKVYDLEHKLELKNNELKIKELQLQIQQMAEGTLPLTGSNLYNQRTTSSGTCTLYFTVTLCLLLIHVHMYLTEGKKSLVTAKQKRQLPPYLSGSGKYM